MSAPDYKDYIEDPELPLEQATGLSGAQADTARRQRYLDRQLKSAFSEIQARVDRDQPDAATFMLRLRNGIEAIDRETAAARKKGERDAAGYLGKIAWQRRVLWLRERFLYNEGHAYRLAAGVAVLVLVLSPLVYSWQSGGSGEMASLQYEYDVAPDAASSRTDENAVALAEDQVSEKAGSAGIEKSKTEMAAEEAEGDEPRLASAPGPGENRSEAKAAADAPSEVVAMRTRDAGIEADPVQATAQQASIQLQLQILEGRLKQATTTEEKLVILRGMRALYEQAGQPKKVAKK